MKTMKASKLKSDPTFIDLACKLCISSITFLSLQVLWLCWILRGWAIIIFASNHKPAHTLHAIILQQDIVPNIIP